MRTIDSSSVCVLCKLDIQMSLHLSSRCFWLWKECAVTPGTTILPCAGLDSFIFPEKCVSLSASTSHYSTSRLAINLVNSTTSYTYDPRTATYLQPVFAFETLQRFLNVNGARLEQLRMQSDVELERRATVPAGTTLAELAKVGIREQALAPTILTATLDELGRQTTSVHVRLMYEACNLTLTVYRFPVLLAIDDFQAIYCKTKYRHPHFARIQPYHLSMPRVLLEYAGGLKTFVSIFLSSD